VADRGAVAADVHGASQFALVGVGAGGGPVAAITTALLLGARNSSTACGWPRRWVRLAPPGGRALTIDESTAMALGQDESDRATSSRFLGHGWRLMC
jgi:predicted branched-subunit amino acid permease